MRVGRLGRRAPAALLFLASAACAAGDGGAGLNGPDVPLPWSVTPLLSVGGAQAVDATAFGRIAGVAFDGAGRLHVLDGDARRVVVVDTAGVVVAVRGAPGDGPGELGSASGLVVGPDGVVTVLDAARRRLVVFAADGTPGPTFAVADSLDLPIGPLAAWGDAWVVGTDDAGLTEPGPDPPPGRALIAHPKAPGAHPRVVWRGWRPPTPVGRPLTEAETGGMRVRLPPLVGFHPRLLAAPLPDGRMAVVDSLDWRVRIVGPDGADPLDLVRPLEPRGVTPALQEAERRRRLAALDADAPRLVRSTSDGARSSVADDAVRRLQEARIDAMGFHDRMPVIGGLRADRVGRLWVARTPVPPEADGPIDIVTPDGGYLGTIGAGALPLPDAFGPRGLVAHLTRDEFGAPVVTVGRLLDDVP